MQSGGVAFFLKSINHKVHKGIAQNTQRKSEELTQIIFDNLLCFDFVFFAITLRSLRLNKTFETASNIRIIWISDELSLFIENQIQFLLNYSSPYFITLFCKMKLVIKE